MRSILKLNHSARSSRDPRSLIRNFRNSEKSTLTRSGPVRTFRPTLPKAPFAGAENRVVSNHVVPDFTWP